MKKNLVFLFLINLCTFFLFGEIKLVSPISGNWANKQMLVIEGADNTEYFYSLNGSDPVKAGFAYDGPVLIDLTGNVTVGIASSAGERLDVSYTVEETFPKSEIAKNLVYSFMESGVLNYTSGGEINIPREMKYTFDDDKTSLYSGRILKLAANSNLSRMIPCMVTDGKIFWRFFIRTTQKTSGSFSRRDLPISVSDWETISFNNQDLIYKIDDSFWSLPKNDMKLDRSVSHIIYWQSINFEPGNPIEFYELPARPQLKKRVQDDKSVVFYFDGDDSYSMCIENEKSSYHELFSEICADTFYGDSVSQEIRLAVYSDSVYQGTFDAFFEVDKRLPAEPLFIATAPNGGYSRGDVSLKVESKKNALLYVAVSEPFFVTEDSSGFDSSKVSADKFMHYNSPYSITLKHSSENPVFYKVRAYSVLGENSSEVTEYTITLDSFNFYFDSNAKLSVEESDGSKEKPFTTFDQLKFIMQNHRSARIFVNGDLKIPKGKTTIVSNCDIRAMKDATIDFTEGASIVVKRATLEITGCQITSNNVKYRGNFQSVLKLENSVLCLNSCSISSLGAKTNTLIDASKSVVTIKNSMVSINSSSYAALLTSVDTHTDISDCQIAVSSDTAIVFSARGSDFKMKNSLLKVSGSIGRIAEFFGTNVISENNEFKANLKGDNSHPSPIFLDKTATMKESGNRAEGF